MPQEFFAKGRWGRRLLLSTAASLLFGAGVVSDDLVGDAGAQAAGQTAPAQMTATVQAPISFADLVERVKPAVVNISTTQKAEVAAEAPSPLPPMPQLPPGSPYEEFFKRFFGDQFGRREGPAPAPMPPGEAHALGSGFIIDPEGWGVTNNHVIGDAAEIEVILQDGTRLEAELKGGDDKPDIALLKVKSDKPLPVVQVGDSDRTRVGDWVVAVGNPFGLGGTVTAGIVSAHGRNINAGPYDDFMQIDAAINRGNSGGPTFNLAGEVVGVNTAIFSPTGGSIGIGFAIPAKMAKMVVSELRDKGRVDRGWLGVQIQDVTPDIAAGLGLPTEKGALVADVLPDGPAQSAGFRQGDVIVQFGEEVVDDAHELPRLVAATEEGRKVPVVVLRGGDKQTIQVQVARMPAEPQLASAVTPPDKGKGDLGMVLGKVTPEMREKLQLAPGIEGVVVQDVAPGGPAARKGIQKGDVILSVNQNPVASPNEVAQMVEQARKNAKDKVVVLLNREGSKRFVALELPA